MEVAADPGRCWSVLTDWDGQRRWIPLTTVRVVGERTAGVGTHVRALSGFELCGLPFGLLDHFVVTGWVPERDLEVLHLGPYFTGEGVFSVRPSVSGTTVACTERFALPGAPATEVPVRLFRHAMAAALRHSLRGLGRVAVGGG